MSIHNVALIVVIVGGILFVIELFQQLFVVEEQTYVRKVTYSKLIHETIFYTGGLLNQNKIKQYPTVDIRYYKHSKWGGLHYGNGKVVIYTKSHKDVHEIVNTVLHEIGHHLQMKTDPKEYNRYNEYEKIHGYWFNPCEIYARDFSTKHLQPCIEYLESKGIISKV